MENSSFNNNHSYSQTTPIDDHDRRKAYTNNNIYFNGEQQQHHIHPNPNYFYVNYNHQQLNPQPHSSPYSQRGFFHQNSSTMPMDTDTHHQHQHHHIYDINRHMSSSLISTPESTPSVSSLSTTSSNSSSSLSINSEPHKNPQLHRSLVADIYDMNGQKVLSSSSSSQHHKKFIRNYQQQFQRPPYLKQMDENELDGAGTDGAAGTRLKRSSESTYVSSSLPKYVKPKICKSSLIVQSVNSKRVAKPQPQLAIMPPFSYNLGNISSNGSEQTKINNHSVEKPNDSSNLLQLNKF
jgi:hypothetical protein